MGVAIIAAIVGASATLVACVMTIRYHQNRDRYKDQREIDLLYGEQKRQLYNQLRNLVEDQKEIVFGAITIGRPIDDSRNQAPALGKLVEEMKITSPELYPLAHSMRMTLLRAMLAGKDRTSPQPEFNVSHDAAYRIWTIADNLDATLLRLMQLDTRGQLRSAEAASLMDELEYTYDFARLSLPPPPPACFNPSIGLR
jgi:hypothetical protein